MTINGHLTIINPLSTIKHHCHTLLTVVGRNSRDFTVPWQSATARAPPAVTQGKFPDANCCAETAIGLGLRTVTA